MSDIAYFNEDKFLPSPRRIADYKAKVELGRQTMKSKTVVIAGLCRNVGPILGKTMARIERTGKMFKDYQVVLFENDSRDNTASQLKDWTRTNKKVRYVTENRDDPINPGVRCLNRATRMATYRNKYRDLIADKYSDFDYSMVVDTDLPGGWSYDGLANSFGQDTDWDFVGSNGIIFKDYEGVANKAVYYDAWAFRWYGSWVPAFARQINPRYWPRGEPMVRVNSCFGGLGLYKTAAMKLARYDGTDCEHVPFHQKMVEAGMDKLFMNPSQIVCY